MRVQWTRRTLLERCVTFGALSIVIPASLSQVAEAWTSAENKKLTPTPSSVLGPFYKRQAPGSAKLRAANDAGMPLALSGVVYSVNGEVLQNAKVEVWQTDHFGHYDNEGYRYRALLESDAKGGYAVDSVLPGHYPDRVCQHVHYLVTAPGHKPLVTQLYFGSDPVFEGNPTNNYTRDPLIGSVELVRPVMIKGEPKEMIAAVTFDLVLEKR